MTAVALLNGPDGFSGFVCEGHAGFADTGSDIVCAAVSILTTTCVNALESVAGIKAQIVERPKDAYLRVMLPENLTKGQYHDAQVLLRGLQQGLSDIQDQYPQYVHLSIQERRKSL